MPGLFDNPTTRRALVLLLLTEVFWGMGSYFVLPTTTIPSYLGTLGAPALVQGGAYVAFMALPMMLGLFSRSVLQRFPHRKRGLIVMHFIIIALNLSIPLLDYLLAGSHRALLMTCIIVAIAVAQTVLGVVSPVWVDMIARIVHPAARGRYFGMAAGALAIGGIAGGFALMGLETWLGNAVYRGAFLATGACFSVGMLMFCLAPIREETFEHPPEPSLASRLRKALAACHLRENFGRFIVSNGLQSFAGAIIPFLVIYATADDGLRLPQGIFTRMTLIQALGGGIGALLLGWWIDHRGSRVPWIVLTLFIPVILLLFPHGTINAVLIGCTLLMGVLNTAWAVSVPAMLEFSPAGDKSGYIAIANLLGFPCAIAGPLCLGGLIEGRGFTSAFALAALAGLLAWAAALSLRAPRRSPAAPGPPHRPAAEPPEAAVSG